MIDSRGENFNRRLCAILYADIHGYSRLMDRDEAGTVIRLTRALALIRVLIGDYAGTVVNMAGDGVLAIFSSAGQAVEFAVEMQREFSKEAAWLNGEEPIAFRIGITVGDAISIDDDIYGHHVNLAARIQSLASPGGICITDTVQQMVGGNPELVMRSLGKQQLKNIEALVEVFAVDPTGAVSRQQPIIPHIMLASAERPPLSNCSLAVLPLENVSADPIDAHLCVGVTADLTSNLCRFRNLMVIARHSSFLVAYQKSSSREIGQQLGARYLLFGNLRRAGHNLRVAVDLIEAESETTIWSERYDGSIADIFAFLDDVTATTASRLAVTIELTERRRISAQYHPDLHAYGLLLRGLDLGSRVRRESNSHARRLYEEARRLDPHYGRSYAAISRTFNVDWRYSWTADPDAALNEALNLAQLAVQYDDLDARGYSEMGLAHLYKKEHDDALSAYERALHLNPNDADLLAEMGDCLVYVRQAERAVTLLEKAIRLNPYHPDSYLWYLGDAYFHLGDYEKTIRTLHKMRDQSEGHRLLAASHALLGELKDAKRHAAAVLEAHPNFTIAKWRRVPPNKHPEDLEIFISGLQMAGLK